MRQSFRGGCFSVLLILGLAGFSGCALFHKPDAALIAGVDAGMNQSGLLDEYDKYIDQDAKLSADSKKIKHDTAAGLRKLVKDAQAK